MGKPHNGQPHIEQPGLVELSLIGPVAMATRRCTKLFTNIRAACSRLRRACWVSTGCGKAGERAPRAGRWGRCAAAGAAGRLGLWSQGWGLGPRMVPGGAGPGTAFRGGGQPGDLNRPCARPCLCIQWPPPCAGACVELRSGAESGSHSPRALLRMSYQPAGPSGCTTQPNRSQANPPLLHDTGRGRLI